MGPSGGGVGDRRPLGVRRSLSLSGGNVCGTGPQEAGPLGLKCVTIYMVYLCCITFVCVCTHRCVCRHYNLV